MSLPETIQIELSIYKPKLKLRLGQLVVGKKDTTRKKMMVVSGFLPIGYLGAKKADYICSWISTQGIPCKQIFREKELLIKES